MLTTDLASILPPIIRAGNLPFVMAPGLGLSAFFTYGLVVKSDPTTAVSWEKAIGFVFMSGVAMVVLSITFLVEKSMKYVPNHIKLGTIIGIGACPLTRALRSFPNAIARNAYVCDDSIFCASHQRQHRAGGGCAVAACGRVSTQIYMYIHTRAHKTNCEVSSSASLATGFYCFES
jgi:xanthine/uracil/vitamin C permease (AzgA family)